MKKLLFLLFFIPIVSFGQTPITDSNIHTAVDLWIFDPEIAESEYGHISNWDTSNVTYMQGLFHGANEFNEDISNWDVSSVTTMNNMFYSSYQFNQNIGSWDVSNVTTMAVMFSNAAAFNQDISNWNVSNVTNMRGMFEYTYLFNSEMGSWDVSNVTNMYRMFSGSNFNKNIESWDIGNVNNVVEMFHNSEFNQDIGNWDITNITDMTGMFKLSEFNQDIGNWNVSNVTNMYQMFKNSEFNQDIGNWNVTNVTTMYQMFKNSEFNQDISDWEFGSVNMEGLFDYSELSTTNFDKFLISVYLQYFYDSGIYISTGWIGAGGLTYCDGLNAYEHMTGYPNNPPLYLHITIASSTGVVPQYDCSDICYITAPSDITIDCDYTNLNLGESSVNGDCSDISIYNDSQSSLNVGENIITWSATTSSGNTITDTQIVTLIDDVMPTIVAPSDVDVYTNNGCTATNVSIGVPETSDNCSVSSVSNNAQSTTYQIGESTVTWTVTDEFGNSASDTQIIKVIDNVSPIISCSDISLTLENGIATITPSDLDTGTYDYCGDVILEIDQAEFNENHIGNNTIVLTATDESGNSTTCESIVTIEAGMSIDYDSLENIFIYPNPVIGKLFIQGLLNPTKISVYNILGKLVFSKTTSSEINVDNLQSGIYILKIVDNQKEIVRRFIKN